MASRTSEKPLQQMKAPTTVPAMPSRSKPVKYETMAAARTAPEVMTSFRESMAVASSVSDEMRLPIEPLKSAIHDLTAIESTRTTITAGPKSVGSGEMIFWTDVMTRLMPTARTSAATVSDARYSKRPCP